MCAAVTGAVLTLMVPVHAWAAGNGAAQISVEALRYRRRGGLGVGAICCLAVVAVIALVIFLIVRRRRR